MRAAACPSSSAASSAAGVAAIAGGAVTRARIGTARCGDPGSSLSMPRTASNGPSAAAVKRTSRIRLEPGARAPALPPATSISGRSAPNAERCSSWLPVLRRMSRRDDREPATIAPKSRRSEAAVNRTRRVCRLRSHATPTAAELRTSASITPSWSHPRKASAEISTRRSAVPHSPPMPPVAPRSAPSTTSAAFSAVLPKSPSARSSSVPPPAGRSGVARRCAVTVPSVVKCRRDSRKTGGPSRRRWGASRTVSAIGMTDAGAPGMLVSRRTAASWSPAARSVPSRVTSTTWS